MVISFQIDERIKKAIQELAQEENRSLSNYINTQLIKHLKSKAIDWREKKAK